MTLWKKAHLNENILEMVRKISLLLGLLVLFLLLKLYAEHYGFNQGILVGELRCENLLEASAVKQPILSGGVGSRTYEYAANTYSSAAFFLVFFVIGKLLEARSIFNTIQTRIISHIFCFATLAAVIYKLNSYLSWKSGRLSDELFMTGNYDELLRQSVPTDNYCFVLVVFLLLLQIAALLFHIFGKTNNRV